MLVYYNSILLESGLDSQSKARSLSRMDQSAVSQRWLFLTKIVAGFFLYLAVSAGSAFSLGQPRYVETTSHPGSFTIAKPGAAASIYVDAEDYAGVFRAAGDLKADIRRVTAQTPVMIKDPKENGSEVILVGTLGKSHIIDGLVHDKKINVSAISGKWESFLIQVVQKPIAGSFQRTGDRGQRQARNDLRHLRSLGADRRLSLVLVGGCSGGAQGCAVRESRQVCARAAGGEVSRHFSE